MDRIIPISDLQSRAKKYVEQVKSTVEPVIVTQRGRAVAVLVDYDTFAGLLATQDEMSFADSKSRLARAERESREGKGVPLERYLRKRARRS